MADALEAVDELVQDYEQFLTTLDDAQKQQVREKIESRMREIQAEKQQLVDMALE